MCDLDWTTKYGECLEPGAEPHPNLDFLRVYLITDRKLLPEKHFLQGVESALKGGIPALQLREKDLHPAELLALARDVRDITQAYGAKLFINGQAEVAEMAEADGVHLPENGESAEEVKKSFPQLLVGVSTHSQETASEAQSQGADFITFSPIFETASKKQYGPPQGLPQLRKIAAESNIPVLALGGVKKENIPSVAEQGAFGIALISGIWSSPDIEEKSYQYMKFFAGEPS
ncbi:MAG: thiamine phosphate synthase [Nitrospinota bacterium]|nr:thiamine phosphate synthase [Nitrospinota bacterium]